jgi:serine/threonine protein kinase
MDLESFMRIKSEDWLEEEVFHIASQIASALDYAHTASSDRPAIAHGGIRLSNVRIEKQETGFSVYLDNFGLMRIIGARAMLSRMSHFLSLSLGKQNSSGISYLPSSFYQDFAFLAPEQREGKERDNDAKSDTYAFGVILYYLLMKRVPEGLFPLPSARYPELQYNWDLLIYHCLQPEKEKRPDSLTQALHDLLQPKTILPSLLHEIEQWKMPKKRGFETYSKPAELQRPAFIEDPPLFIVDPVVALSAAPGGVPQRADPDRDGCDTRRPLPSRQWTRRA